MFDETRNCVCEPSLVLQIHIFPPFFPQKILKNSLRKYFITNIKISPIIIITSTIKHHKQEDESLIEEHAPYCCYSYYYYYHYDFPIPLCMFRSACVVNCVFSSSFSTSRTRTWNSFWRSLLPSRQRHDSPQILNAYDQDHVAIDASAKYSKSFRTRTNLFEMRSHQSHR